MIGFSIAYLDVFLWVYGVFLRNSNEEGVYVRVVDFLGKVLICFRKYVCLFFYFFGKD